MINWLPHVPVFLFRLHWLTGLICVIVIGFSMFRVIIGFGLAFFNNCLQVCTSLILVSGKKKRVSQGSGKY